MEVAAIQMSVSKEYWHLGMAAVTRMSEKIKRFC